MSQNASALTIIPTYNEIDNLEIIVGRLLAAAPRMNILIVDDGSPDGTGALADTMAAADDRIFAIHRTGKLGLGSAYLKGFAWGLERDYDLLIEMDADGSHPPETLPAMIEAVWFSAGSSKQPVGLVIGSRWTSGGSVVNWPVRREVLSRGANFYARLALGISVADATAGYRVYRAEVLRGLDLNAVDSLGYCFQIDLTLRTLTAGYAIREIPIVFTERERGESKMSGNIIVEAMRRVTVWGAQRRLAQLSRLFKPRTEEKLAIKS